MFPKSSDPFEPSRRAAAAVARLCAGCSPGRAVRLLLLLFLFLPLAVPAGHALELGPPQIRSGLGQPLEVRVPLRLAAGDRPGQALAERCLQVELLAGERVLAQGELLRSVDWRLPDGRAEFRLQTRGVMSEPLLSLALGCPRRQFSLLLDPDFKVVSGSLPATKPVGRLARLASEEPLRFAPSAAGKPDAAAARLALRLRLDPGGAPGMVLPARSSDQASAAAPAAVAGAPEESPPRPAGLGLLLSFDVQESLEDTAARPDRFKQAEAQLLALAGERSVLDAEMAQLGAALSNQEQGRQQSLWWTVAAVLAALIALALAFWRVRRPRPQGWAV